MTASELLASTRRQQWLQSLWDYSSLPKDMYRQYYLAPLEHCVTLMQQFPLKESGLYARPGGMADYMLETVSYAARLSKSYMLPVGAPPEEQAAQSAAWNAVVVYAAMLPSLEYLCHLHVELENGKWWFQKAFERLGHYRQDYGTMYTCQLYQDERREGRFQKLSGYLVPASKIFTSDNNPGDNPLLVVLKE